MNAVEQCFVTLDTKCEDFVRLNMAEIEYLTSVMQYLPQHKQHYLENYLNVDSDSLYVKLFNSFKSLHEQQIGTGT